MFRNALLAILFRDVYKRQKVFIVPQQVIVTLKGVKVLERVHIFVAQLWRQRQQLLVNSSMFANCQKFSKGER